MGGQEKTYHLSPSGSQARADFSPTPNIPVPPWNSLWQLSQVSPFWNPAPFMPGFEPTEMIWLGFGLVLRGAGMRRKEFRTKNPFPLLSIII